MTMKWCCMECGWRGTTEEIIRFPDPEANDNEWQICPKCRAAEQFTNMCDEPGCNKPASGGWFSPEGYRRTCFEHARITR